jgi:hypothetical protein
MYERVGGGAGERRGPGGGEKEGGMERGSERKREGERI